MKRRALRKRMVQRQRCVASNFKLTRSRIFYSAGQQKENDGKPLECDKRDAVITCVFCREFTQHGFFALLQKNLFKGM